MDNKINIKNKKAYYNYQLSEFYTAGIVLMGTEIKSIRQGKLSFVDPFCIFKIMQLFANEFKSI